MYAFQKKKDNAYVCEHKYDLQSLFASMTYCLNQKVKFSITRCSSPTY
jgi:hypothetical protein